MKKIKGKDENNMGENNKDMFQENMEREKEMENNPAQEESKDAAPAKKSKKGKIFTIIAILLVLGLVIFRIVDSKTADPEEKDTVVSVRATEAKMMSIKTTSPITGRVEPVEEVNIVPLANGEVTRVYVEVGDRVKEGQVLFTVDQTQASVTLNQAKTALNLAKSTYDRMSALYREGACSYQDYQQAESSYANAQQTYTSASDVYGNCSVTSPINGYVTAKNVTEGGLATSAGGAAMVVADVSQLVVNTTVSEYIVNDLKEGDVVSIYIKTLGDKPFKGVIDTISPAPATGSLTYPIKIRISGEESQIKAGMFAEVRIQADEKDDVIAVPSDSVLIKSGKPVVVVLNKKNVASYVNVTTGLDNGKYVEIKKGLKEGDRVVYVGQQYVKEGSEVRIKE